MSEYLRPIGEDEPVVASDPIARIEAATAEILRSQKEEESRRRWTLLLTIGGALFAAVRLGIIVLPAIRKRRSAAPGALQPATNPARRRR